MLRVRERDLGIGTQVGEFAREMNRLVKAAKRIDQVTLKSLTSAKNTTFPPTARCPSP